MQTLISREEILARIAELKIQISEQHYDYIICILKGAYIFFTDLVTDLDVKIDFVKVHSYAGKESTGTLTADLLPDFTKLQGKKVLLVDDICDTGLTLNKLKELFLKNGVKTVNTCVLLNKKDKHSAEFEPTFYAFSIKNEFVIGYGLDYDEKYRTMQNVYIM